MLDTVEKKVKYILEKKPKLSEDNTELYISFIQFICHSRSQKRTWSNIKDIMREYPPESVARARRAIADSTKEQMDKEAEYREKHGNPAYAKPDYKNTKPK